MTYEQKAVLSALKRERGFVSLPHIRALTGLSKLDAHAAVYQLYSDGLLNGDTTDSGPAEGIRFRGIRLTHFAIRRD